ncbi:23S rRNA pseudouridine955/2504/2580 synthase [Hydrogenoanaerobacterium saccharovorans]|uniref:Pseudouridine synthase n=1 Tax=Hydrogenoanaerobacterium saccharovorans TaxID=474960 RepID=A0A1H7ZJQ7_9FIRM|nr:RluA family pseudouridine synthase [Hydrogenoanaerobacterium saccharovorans]RPF48599.1 23S rRNA pseudouridine955/2504/2580 synthase [Hydrogenoanaerobacterium saccharovorans]SEM57677.1 23S rRNA pseudouridine955/2504/2580 synthase [Hydrogenoanaerobacterium saccharovorans]
MRSFIINSNDAGQRVDKFITKALPRLPQPLLYKYIRLKRIKLNRKRCEISTHLNEGDVLDMYINDEFFSDVALQCEFKLAPTTLDIVYEDKNILLVNKKPGLVVHEDESGQADTLINRIQHYLFDKGEYNPDEEHSFAPALCNRIDRNTGGIVIAAKNAATLRVLNQKIKDRELTKRYLAVIHGTLEKKSATLEAYLAKDSTENKVTVTKYKTPENKIIRTKYRVLAENPRFSLIEVDLLTGRTHQIRAHFAFIGHPLLGDTKYGFARDNKGTNYKYQALYSHKLIFNFITDAGHLGYLNGKEFYVEKVWFAEDFMNGKII